MRRLLTSHSPPARSPVGYNPSTGDEGNYPEQRTKEL
jgi:hypothetical protein